MTPLSIVGVAGSVTRPSRTAALVRATLAALQAETGGVTRLVDLADEGEALLAALTPDRLSLRARAIIEAVEAADILVVGTPVYRGSYTGAFKHLFDLVRHDGFIGKPVILTATGGSHLHALVTEHQLRPLFGFFGAHTVPTTVYATEADFTDYRISSEAITGRIGRATREAVRLAGLVQPAAVVPQRATAIA